MNARYGLKNLRCDFRRVLSEKTQETRGIMSASVINYVWNTIFAARGHSPVHCADAPGNVAGVKSRRFIQQFFTGLQQIP